MSHVSIARRVALAGLAAIGLAAGAGVVAPAAVARPTLACDTNDVFEFTTSDSSYESDAFVYSARAVVGCPDPERTYSYSLQIWSAVNGTVRTIVDQAASNPGLGSFTNSGSFPLGHQMMGGHIYGTFTAPTGYKETFAFVRSCTPEAAFSLDYGDGYLGSRVVGTVSGKKQAPTCPEPIVTGWEMEGVNPLTSEWVDLASSSGAGVDYQPARLWGPSPDFGYVLRVHLTNGYGETANESTFIVQRNHPPVIESVQRTKPRELTATVTDVDNGGGMNYQWSVDGYIVESAHGPKLDLTALPVGTYNVQLVATDLWGTGTTWNSPVTIVANPVHAAVVLSAPDNGGAAPRAVTYDASSSTGPGKLHYHWAFEDGTTADSWKPTVTKTWTTPCDTATGTVTVSDAAGNEDLAYLPDVNVTGRLVEMTRPQYAVTNRGAAFKGTVTDCSGTADPTATGQYRWDFGDGTTGTGKAVNHTWTTAGDYEVKLTWTQGRQTATTTIPVHVTAAHAELNVNTRFCNGPCTVQFKLNRSFGALVDGVPCAIVSWRLDFGDGSTVRTGTGPVPTTVFRHAYGRGMFSPTLTITDAQGNTDTGSTSVITSFGGAG